MATSRSKGITVEIDGDTTGLSKALRGVNKEIKSTRVPLKAEIISVFLIVSLREKPSPLCVSIGGGSRSQVLQYILGHSNINVTMDVYNHVDEERTRKEVNRPSYAEVS